MSMDIKGALPIGLELKADLTRPLSYDDGRRMRELLHQHGLLLFRGQRIDPLRQIELMTHVGTVLHAPDGIGYVSNKIGGRYLGVGEISFHSDLSFTAHPYKAISLHPVEMVAGASVTRFADAARAYAGLPRSLQRRLQELRALSVMPLDRATDRLGETVPQGMPQRWQPVVLSHPVTGAPILYVNPQQSSRIDGMTARDSAALLAELFAVLGAEDNVYEHRWQDGDLLIWDNLLLQHGRSALHNSGGSTLQRVVVADKSFFDLCPQIDVKDPDYQRWIKSPDQAADRHLIEAVLARATGRPVATHPKETVF